MKKEIFFLCIIALIYACNKKDSDLIDTNTSVDSIIPIDENQNILRDSLVRAYNDSVEKARLDSIAQRVQDSLSQMQKKKKNNKVFEVFEGEAYSYWPIKVSDSLRKLFYQTFNKEQQYVIAALNRIDTDHINRRDTLIVPNVFKQSFIEYSPFPNTVKLLQQVDKFVIFSYPIQAFAVYEHGKLIKWGPSNMGKQSAQTPRQLYFTNWKGRKVRSTVDDEWILNWNFNLHNTEGVGWHQYALPGYPASHSCLRLLDADAQWLYNWADQWVLQDKHTVKVKGTPTVVYGDYTFGVKGIWHQLVKNPSITTISESELTKEIEPYINEILKQQDIRRKYRGFDNPTLNDTLNIVKDSLI